ncbi:Methyltransferase type 12 [Pseudomonas putida]|nr:Methyltransferase type 12 [Pseudomonas putida]
MSLDAQYFADLYADNDDPWAFRTRWYERRKRDLALASLPRQYYERVFEPACANGELSILLSERCAELLCQDIDPTAVALAASGWRARAMPASNRATCRGLAGRTVRPDRAQRDRLLPGTHRVAAGDRAIGGQPEP